MDQGFKLGDTVLSIRTQLALECPKLQTVLTIYLRQWQAIFETRSQRPKRSRAS
jgi:hypothetical protein